MPLIHNLLEKAVANHSDETAIIFGDQRVNYRELGEASDSLANEIRSRCSGEVECVPLFVDRSIEMIVAIIAILKSGTAYIPIDPSYPKKRIESMLTASRAGAILTQRSFAPNLSSFDADLILCEDQPKRNRSSETQNTCLSFESPNRLELSSGTQYEQSDSSLAYIIFTSGSTGEPKGVAMPHKALSNLLFWQQTHIPIRPRERVLQFTSVSFDVSFQEIFSTLCYGGTLVLIDEYTRRDPQALWNFIEEYQINRILLPFVALDQIAEAATKRNELPQSLAHVITAGEQLKATTSLRQLFKRIPNAQLHNHYGPSETHVVTSYTLPRNSDTWDDLPPIGMPISKTKVRFIDHDQNEIEDGTAGELLFGGACLAEGYYNRPDITKERFVCLHGSRYYRTGDLGIKLPDGNIQYLGRSDHQVKIRGHRVELGEIETVLASYQNIKGCAVATMERSGQNELAAYLVFDGSAGEMPTDQIKAFLSEHLASYMIPNEFHELESLPLTPSGKLDRKSLESYVLRNTEPSSDYIKPKPGLESKIASIWKETLGKKWISRTDNFFDIGGTSISIVKVRDSLDSELGKTLAVAELFQYPTLAELAKHVEPHISETVVKTRSINERAKRQRAAMQSARARRGQV